MYQQTKLQIINHFYITTTTKLHIRIKTSTCLKYLIFYTKLCLSLAPLDIKKNIPTRKTHTISQNPKLNGRKPTILTGGKNLNLIIACRFISIFNNQLKVVLKLWDIEVNWEIILYCCNEICPTPKLGSRTTTTRKLEWKSIPMELEHHGLHMLEWKQCLII